MCPSSDDLKHTLLVGRFKWESVVIVFNCLFVGSEEVGRVEIFSTVFDFVCTGTMEGNFRQENTQGKQKLFINSKYFFFLRWAG